MRVFKHSCFAIILLLLLPLCVDAADIKVPQYRGYVNDFANIIPPSDEQAIAAYIASLEKATTAEIAVVTVQTVRPNTIEQYATAIFDQWGVGKKDKDNGLVVLVALKDHEMRIEVGYGLEHLIPDAEAWRIISKVMRPAFKQSNYAFGISQAVMQMGSIIAADQGVTVQQPAMQMPAASQKGPPPWFLCGGFPLFVIVIIVISVLRLVPYMLLGRAARGGFWSSGGFSSGGGGFGGGFGGFGGGSSGGGGASGGW